VSFARNPMVEWLLSHSYGQGGTVAVPSSQSASGEPMPRGQFPPGITDALDYLANRYTAWSDATKEVDWCFLVGGPGNGKSEALKDLTSRLGISLPPRALGQAVPRTIPKDWPSNAHRLPSGLDVMLINDASIPRTDIGDGDPGSLFKDLNDALGRVSGAGPPVAVFGNVNRGILVEEASCLPNPNRNELTEQLASSIIRWLASPPASVTEEARFSDIQTVVVPDPNAPQYGQFRVLIHGAIDRVVVLHIVFLDALSLLEPTPGGGSPVIDFRQSPPARAQYQTFGNLVSAGTPRDRTTAGDFVTSFGLAKRWSDGGCRESTTGSVCEAYSTCPFAQNSRWIEADSLRHRFLDALRGAEVAAGRRLTYRDLLGHISLALIGVPEESWLTGTHPCQWAADQHLGINAGQKKAVVNVISHRIYANLFPSTSFAKKQRLERELADDTVYGSVKRRVDGKGEPPRLQAFERAFGEIDPAADTDAWQGMRARVLDAIEALDILSPSDQLRTWPEIAVATGSDAEGILDQALRDEITSELKRGTRSASNRARFLRKWRSTLMLRQIGLALGNLTHGMAIQAWLAEQENALRGGSRLRLGDGIHNLIVTRHEGNRIYLAPLRPRTYCLVDDLPPNTLLFPITVNDLDVVIIPQGDTIVAEVQGRSRQRRAPQALASLVIDLAVAREAILHADEDARSFTEIGYTAFARIERARASLISRERLRTGDVYFTNEKKDLYRVVANPSGPVPLRVEQS
jgi:hypothetical protein